MILLWTEAKLAQNLPEGRVIQDLTPDLTSRVIRKLTAARDEEWKRLNALILKGTQL